MITLKNIHKKFGQKENTNTIYESLNFEVNSGEFIAIIGKSGTGKSTLLNIMSGLTDISGGEIIIDGKKISDFSQDQMTKFRGKNMSFIFQQFHLIPNLSVQENIELVGEINDIEAQFSISDLLKKVDLEEKIDAYPYELSGGQQQRVAIARSFYGKTPILFADEPTGNLDEQNAQNIMKILKNLHKETKNTVVLITHDQDIASYADKIYKLENNTLILQK